ncbi:K1324 protein, partial [Amia calva]|nr:K1324 protein [Amia calva]
LQSDYHFEYTECDSLGSRWRVAVPHTPGICTGVPDPIKGTQCSFSCKAGEYLEMKEQSCVKCASGTYSLGTGVRIDEWDVLPPGFVSVGTDMEMDLGSKHSNCSNSTWTPKGDYIASNTDECTSTLSYAVNLKQTGSVSFEYLYPDNSIFFEFYVQNDQCQSTDTQTRWMKSTDTEWEIHFVQLSRGSNVLYWKTTGFLMGNTAAKPVLVRNVAISGVAYTSECFPCKPGTYTSKPGSALCAPCPENSYSNKGATVCSQCDGEKYAEIGSGSCKPRPPCNATDYFYTHTPCDANGQTQLMYKWSEPKICSENVEGAVKLPASGEKITCPPCNPGFFKNNMSNCQPCPYGSYSNGTDCVQCPAGTEPMVGFEYKWWNTMPRNMKSSVLSREYSSSGRETAWEVAGEYVYTTPGDLDSDYQMLTLTVPGYRLPQSVAKDTENTEMSRITFVFETQCSADCTLHFMAGYGERANTVLEHWSGSRERQSYTYIINSNATVSFTWAFQRTGDYTTERKYSSDFAKLYSIHISNAIDGVASECRHCALGSAESGSSCVPCPPGHYIVSGSSACKQCPPNTFISPDQPVGKQACIPCGPNTNSNELRSACYSDCKLEVVHEGQSLEYDFSPLSNTTSLQSGPRFTSRGLKYFNLFSISLCGNEGRKLASCVDNITESRREVAAHVCQSAVIPSDVRGLKTVVSSQPFSIADRLIGITTDTVLDYITSPEDLFPDKTPRPDVIFYFRSLEVTQACKTGRATTIRVRCDPESVQHQLSLPSKCHEGTCDGCSFHFLWRSRQACPLCSKNDYKEIVSACIQGIQRTTYVWQEPRQCAGGVSLPEQKVSACVTMDFWLKFGVSTGTLTALLLVAISCYFWKKTRKLEYKYSKLVSNSSIKDCELPAADSCAIMEGEDAEDDLLFLTKKSIFGKMKSFTNKVGAARSSLPSI